MIALRLLAVRLRWKVSPAWLALGVSLARLWLAAIR